MRVRVPAAAHLENKGLDSTIAKRLADVLAAQLALSEPDEIDVSVRRERTAPTHWPAILCLEDTNHRNRVH